MTDTGNERLAASSPEPGGSLPTGDPDRAHVRRVGCFLGSFALFLFVAVFVWKLGLLLTSR